MKRLAALLAATALASCSTPAPDATKLNPDGSVPLGKHQRHPATYASTTASPDGPRPFAYRTDIRPLIQSRCTRCHCPSLASFAGDLDLTTREAALSTGRHAPVIIPGSAATSPFIHKLVTKNAEGKTVPLPGGPHALSPRSINDLTRWINEGADWTY